jgi:hypothetical protein
LAFRSVTFWTGDHIPILAHFLATPNLATVCPIWYNLPTLTRPSGGESCLALAPCLETC